MATSCRVTLDDKTLDATCNTRRVVYDKAIYNPGTDEGFYGSRPASERPDRIATARTSSSPSTTWISRSVHACRAGTAACCGITHRLRVSATRAYGLVSQDLAITVADGKPGGFAATYSINGSEKLTRVEADIEYRFIRDMPKWPKELLSDRPRTRLG